MKSSKRNLLISAIGMATVGGGSPLAHANDSQLGNKYSVSILDYPANGISGPAVDPNGRIDSGAGIQAAIDDVFSRGGGSVFFPPAANYYLIRSALKIKSGVTLFGMGPKSRIHSLNRTRLSGILSSFEKNQFLENVRILDLNITAGTNFEGGRCNFESGGGIFLNNCRNSSVENCYVSNWSDGGIFFADSSFCAVKNNHVENVAQGVGFVAIDHDCFGNQCVGNFVFNSGTYNGVHLEGGFGDGPSHSLFNSVVSGNVVSSSYNRGITIEVAPYTSCMGNTVKSSGLISGDQFNSAPWGRPKSPATADIGDGIFVFGSSNSTVVGNVVEGTTGNAISIAASKDCVVNGNSISGQRLAAIWITDYRGTNVAHRNVVGFNSYVSGGVVVEGNSSLQNNVLNLKFQNLSSKDANTLDWYEEGIFKPLIISSSGGNVSYTRQSGRFTRIGNLLVGNFLISYSSHSGRGRLAIQGFPYIRLINSYDLGFRFAASGISNSIERTLVARVAPKEDVLYIEQYDASSSSTMAVETPSGSFELRCSFSCLVSD